MSRILRRIEIEELDTGYKVTTDVRWGLGPVNVTDEVEAKKEAVRKELAIDKLNKVLKIVKTYLGADLEENKS